jgi:hypothetical protein
LLSCANPAVLFLSDIGLLETHHLESPFHDPLAAYNDTPNLGTLEGEYYHMPHKFSTFSPIELAKEEDDQKEVF